MDSWTPEWKLPSFNPFLQALYSASNAYQPFPACQNSSQLGFNKATFIHRTPNRSEILSATITLHTTLINIPIAAGHQLCSRAISIVIIELS